ncbi:hypothetical protein [Nocardia wallacei]|uniref:hypothetical protein n=1 Tax=Nocardia wallacei TaxID=480035 RepID=UPI002458CC76|nr:hypothetical protein [Nocardia wallacei]
MTAGVVATLFAAPAAPAAGDEIAIINGIVYQDRYNDLAGCIDIGPMDITVENHTSDRTAYIYRSDNCSGPAEAAIAPGTTATAYGTTVDFKRPSGGGSFGL